MHNMTRLAAGLCFAAAAAAAGFAQDTRPAEIIGGPLAGRLPFTGAPFSADAITTARHTLKHGTLDQSATARYYRDSEGRVRVEHPMEGLRAPKTMSERHIRLTIFTGEPWGLGFSLDPVSRTARNSFGRSIRPLATGGGRVLGVPVGGVRFVTFQRAQDWLRRNPELADNDGVQREELGTKRISGVEAVGGRITLTFPPAYFADVSTVTLIDEQWESAELDLIVYAHYSDSRSGFVEYRLTNIRRAEPPADLFVVPADYTMLTEGYKNDPWIRLFPPELYKR